MRGEVREGRGEVRGEVMEGRGDRLCNLLRPR